MDPVTMAALIGGGSGILSSVIARKGNKQAQPQKYTPFTFTPELEKLAMQMFYAKLAQQARWRPGMLTGQGYEMLNRAGGFNPRMPIPAYSQSQGFQPNLITGGK